MTDPIDAPDQGRRTPLFERHEALGATFTDFGGWRMPVRYGSDLEEHRAVRTAAGLFDLSHMGEVELRGPGAAAALDAALGGTVSAMPVGRAKYSLVLTEAGGVLDDVIVYRTADEAFLVVVNAGNRDAAAAALAERAAGFDAVVDDRSDDTALVAVQGPAAERVLLATGAIAVDGGDDAVTGLRYYRALGASVGGERALVARTGYTGEDGFEVILPAGAAGGLWDALLAAGAGLGLVPAGLAARDTLRLEAGMPLHGHELSVDVQPAQAGLSRVVSPEPAAEYVGRAAVARGPGAGAPVLVGLALDGRRAARAGSVVSDSGGAVGVVTSGALSPTLGHPIAFAFVAPGASEPGTTLSVDVRGTALPAVVVPTPFYRRGARA